MILSENEQRIEKFCQDIRYQVGLLDSHMVVLKDGEKPLITEKQYAESILSMLKKVAEFEEQMPEDYQREKTLNDKLIETQNRLDDVRQMLNEVMQSIDKEANGFDEQVHSAIDEVIYGNHNQDISL